MKFNSFLLFICILVSPALVKAEGDGFGENPGGAGGDTIIVDNADDFKHYAGLSEPLVILVKDTIDVGSEVRVTSYKTISGIDSCSTVKGALSIKGGTTNVVVKNLNITNPAGDGITVREATYVYITHCTVYDCGDGCIDITVESDFVTVSYCRFYYEDVSVHKFVNLIGASDDDISDRGKLHVTMHHNWWDTGCTSRMPRVRFGRVHVYNNYLSCVNNNYANRAAIEAEIFSERNYFDGLRDPLTTDQDGKARSLENEYVNCEGTIHPGTDEVFFPSYMYTSETALQAKEEAIQYAGNKFSSVVIEEKKETIINWTNQDAIIFGTPLSETQLCATAEGNTSTPVYSHDPGTLLPGGYQTLTVTFPEDENYKAASKTISIEVEYEYFSLEVNAVDANGTNLVKVSPGGEMIDGKLMYIKDTEVSLTAGSNLVSTFDHWEDGQTDNTLSIVMSEDQHINAYYNSLNYIVAWDLFDEGNYDRLADFSSVGQSISGILQLLKAGTSNTFGLFYGDNTLVEKNAATIRRGSSSVGDYYFQIAFRASTFKNIWVEAAMLGMNTYYAVQNVEYSIDGENFTKIGEYNLNKDSVWYKDSFQLPAEANGRDSVFVRFKADKNSSLIDNGTIGTSVCEIIVLADQSTSVVIARKDDIGDLKILYKQFYTLDGRQVTRPVQGINIMLIYYEDGSFTSKKFYYSGNDAWYDPGSGHR